MATISIISYVISLVSGLAVGLIVHFIQAYGLFRMAKACGLQRSWLAWIPVLNNYTVGAIAKCNAVKLGKKPLAYDKILLILNIVSTVFAGIMYVLLGYAMVDMFEGLLPELYSAEFLMNPTFPEIDIQKLLISLMSFGLVYLVLFVVSVIHTIFWYMALWQIFKLFDEKNDVVYLVLCLLIGIATPIIFIILGNKRPDLGIPSADGYDAYGQSSYQPPYGGL